MSSERGQRERVRGEGRGKAPGREGRGTLEDLKDGQWARGGEVQRRKMDSQVGERPNHETEVSAIYSKGIRRPLKVCAGNRGPCLCTSPGVGGKCRPKEIS